MELRQLAYFVAVGEDLSFGRAAERLHIVQPAVSQQVRRLERELGVRLFERSSRHVRLTAAGRQLMPVAQAVLAAADKVRLVAASIESGERDALRVGTSQGLGERLERLLEQLHEVAPGLEVRLVGAPAEHRLAKVRTGELDAAFVRVMTSAPGLELVPLWEEQLSVALPAAHHLAAAPCVELAQLSALPLRLASRQDNPWFHDLVIGACTAAGFVPLPGPTFTNLDDTLAEMGTGPASWTVLYSEAANRLAVTRVAFRPLEGLVTRTSLAIPPSPWAPALSKLVKACLAICAVS
ncbi:MAG: LysR family transcriptional regulator [Acidimicrobiales bacterium]